MRIFLAEHESNVRYGLRVLLEERSEWEVVGEAADADGVLARIEGACPDLLLLSWELPGLAGADLLPALRSVCDEMNVIVLSGRPEERQVILDAGVSAFISKAESPERLVAAIVSVGHRHPRGD
ncbi:MAG: response regulator transcription factor [Anaerolineae bacterium]|jgi:DNA-binding NarL/FixJ family response regulator